MSISIDTIRSLDAGKSYYLANSTGDIKEAGAWQKFKCFFGVGDGREKVAKLVEAVKESLLKSAGMETELALQHETGALDTSKSISGAALKQIAKRFSTVNAKDIAFTTARSLMNIAVKGAARNLLDRGVSDPAVAENVRDVLRRSVIVLLKDPAMTETGDGRKVLDITTFNWAMKRRLADAETKLEEIANSDALGRPRLDKFYARHVMDALWTEEGHYTGRDVKDLTPAANVRFEAARSRAEAGGLYTGGADDDAVDAAIRAAVDACTDPDAMEIVVDDIARIVQGGDGSIREPERIRAKVAALCANFAELRQLSANDPDLLRHGKELLRLFHGKAFPQGTIGRVVQAVWEENTTALKGLSAASSGMEIFRAAVQISKGIERTARESGIEDSIDGPDEQRVVREFILQLLVGQIGEADRKGLKEAFSGENAAKLQKTLTEISGGRARVEDNLPAGVQNAVKLLTQQLTASMMAIHAGLAFRFGEETDGIPALPGMAPLDEFGAEELPDEILALAREEVARKKADYIAQKVHGEGQTATRLRNVLSNKLGPEPNDPESMMRDKLTRIVSNIFNRTLALNLQAIANGEKPQFDSDIKRFSAIRLKGVGTIDGKDVAKAYDQFAQLVTKNPAATYAGLEPAAKRKADLAMAFTTQTLGNAIVLGVGALLHPNGSQTGFGAMGGNITMAFDVDFTDEGDLEVKFTRLHKPTLIQFDDMEPMPCGPGSEVKHEVTVKVFSNEVNRLADLNFRNYDDKPLKQFIDVELGPDCYERARWQMPEAFRFTYDVAVDWSADLK